MYIHIQIDLSRYITTNTELEPLLKKKKIDAR